MTTFVQLVNSVLTHIREINVVNVTDTTYSTMIGAYVNDAKREVEDSWQWGSLLDYIDIPVTTGVSVYNINTYNGAISGLPMNERARPRRDLKSGKFAVYNTTQSFEGVIPQAQWEALVGYNAQNVNWNVTDQPTQFAFSSLARGSWVPGLYNRNIQFYPIPNGNYTMRVVFTNPSDDLVNSSDLIYLPKEPILHRALMFALYEKGEELGETLTLTQEKYKAALADAIAHDQSLMACDFGFDVGTTTPTTGYYTVF